MNVIDKIQEQLDWRGPNGKCMGHIVITREDALNLVTANKTLVNALDILINNADANDMPAVRSVD